MSILTNIFCFFVTIGIGRFSGVAPMSLSSISSSLPTSYQYAQSSEAKGLDYKMSTGSAGGLIGRRTRRSVHELDRNFTCPEPNCTRRYGMHGYFISWCEFSEYDSLYCISHHLTIWSCAYL